MADLTGKRVAILVHNYFEEAELAKPLEALQNAHVEVDIIAPKQCDVQAMQHDTDKSQTFHVDHALSDINIEDYDALVLPGGTVNADQLRTVPEALEAIKTMMTAGKPLAVICHAPWTLISAGLAKGKHLTSFFTLKDDLQNAGANWVNEEVVIDGNLITSRNPDDLPAFNNAIITMLQKQPALQRATL